MSANPWPTPGITPTPRNHPTPPASPRHHPGRESRDPGSQTHFREILYFSQRLVAATLLATRFERLMQIQALLRRTKLLGGGNASPRFGRRTVAALWVWWLVLQRVSAGVVVRRWRGSKRSGGGGRGSSCGTVKKPAEANRCALHPERTMAASR